MAYKNQVQIGVVDEQIDALDKDEYLDASDIGLTECRMFLSTHQSCSYHIVNPLRAQQSRLINTALVENLVCEYDDCLVENICPSEIHSGMLITQHGYTGRVVKVDRYENIWRGVVDASEPYVYVVRMEYVSGDLSMHMGFRDRINNGCDQGHLSSQQGNRLATFRQVIEK